MDAKYKSIPEDKFKQAERLIYEHQRTRLEKCYREYEGLDDVRELFFNMIYVRPDRRDDYEDRNKSFIRSARSRLLRIIVSEPVIRTLNEIIELNDLTGRIHQDMSFELCKLGKLPEELDEETFFMLSRQVSTVEDRRRQLQCAMDGYRICADVVLHFPMNLDQLIRFVPKALIRNSELLELAIKTYRCFNKHKDKLHEYREVIKTRETDYIDRMFRVGKYQPGDGGNE